MRPFPPATDLQFLVGLHITQICLDPWHTQFRFQNGGQILIEDPFEHLEASGRTHQHQVSETQDRGPVFFRDLIQQPITGLDRQPWRLTLTFANGAVLRIASEDGPYESGQITPPSGDRGVIMF